MSARLPRIGITLGDVAGVGPETVAGALATPEIRRICNPVVFGHPEIFRRAAKLVGVPVELVEVDSPEELSVDAESAPCINPSDDSLLSVPPGQVDARAGGAAYDSLIAAIRAAQNGTIDAIVTAPLNKLALHRAGHDYPGHTEILKHECGVPECAMMLYLPPGEIVASPRGLGVAHVTLHTSLASVPSLLSAAAVSDTTRLIDRFMRRVGCESPRIGVCALNPHAGEGGLFGDEESRVIAPAVETCRKEAIQAAGPFPADTLLKRAVEGEFDGVCAMYHDQGHIALKLLAFHRAVNVTLGLPIIRTSPTQGTAFDIAWQGKADPTGMIEAIRVAVQLAEGRMTGEPGT